MSVEEVIGRLKVYEEHMKGSSESDNRKLLLTHKEWTEKYKKRADGDSKQSSNRGGFSNSRGGRGRGRNGSGRGGRGRGNSHHQKEGGQGSSNN